MNFVTKNAINVITICPIFFKWVTLIPNVRTKDQLCWHRFDYVLYALDVINGRMSPRKRILVSQRVMLCEVTRGFPKIDHSGIDARIVLEQNKFSKKKKATSDMTWTPDPRTFSVAHFFPSCLTPVLNPHCLVDWEFNDPYLVMLYWFLDFEDLRGFSWNQ